MLQEISLWKKLMKNPSFKITDIKGLFMIISFLEWNLDAGRSVDVLYSVISLRIRSDKLSTELYRFQYYSSIGHICITILEHALWLRDCGPQRIYDIVVDDDLHCFAWICKLLAIKIVSTIWTELVLPHYLWGFNPVWIRHVIFTDSAVCAHIWKNYAIFYLL